MTKHNTRSRIWIIVAATTLSLILITALLLFANNSANTAWAKPVSSENAGEANSVVYAPPTPEPGALKEKRPLPYASTSNLLVAVDATYWPMVYYSGTEIVGHDIDLMDAIAAEMNVTVVYTDISWGSIITGLIDGEYEAIISGMSVTPEREAVIYFTLPYLTVGIDDNIAIAVQSGDDLLRRQFNGALLELRNDGTLGTIISAIDADAPAWLARLPDWPSCWARLNDELAVYSSPQTAVDASTQPSDVVKVAGTCSDVSVRPRDDITTTGVVTQVIYISKSLTIQGGYTTTNWMISNPDAYPTTLDAQGQGRVIYITGDISPTVEGFLITGGDATGMGGDSFWEQDAGGGVYITGAAATIENNRVFDNIAENGGGAFLYASAATLIDNVFSDNTTHRGGGLSLLESYATLSQNTIISNTAGWGGGFYLHSDHSTLSDNLIADNLATGWGGGGLYLWWSDTKLESNTIISNTHTDQKSGGLYLHGSDPLLVNNIIAGNHGDGMYFSGSSPQLLHNTIARNGGRNGGSGVGIAVNRYIDIFGDPHYSTVNLTNTILVSHTVGISVSTGNTVTLEGTLWWGNGSDWFGAGMIFTDTVNVWGDPAFVDTMNGDYHITPGSAAVDAGLAAGVDDDIDGDGRPYGSGYDLGADENTICDSVGEIPTQECQALVALYESTDGDNWFGNNGWLVSNTPCTWQGVSCDGGHVTVLDLADYNLSGTIPTELGYLDGLTHLWLDVNQLRGSMPVSLGSMSSLQELGFNWNHFSGSIPESLGNLTNLEVIRLDDNQLTGTIPASLGNLSNLRDLSLNWNDLTGSIPTELGNLFKIEGIGLRENQLSGIIPPELGLLTRMTAIDWSFNQLSGSIPTTFGYLTNTWSILLDGNQLSGSIPETFGNLTGLTFVGLSGNQLSGVIPHTFGNLVNMEHLDMERNLLTGTIPYSMGKMTNLHALYLGNNQLSGNIPPEFGDLSSLEQLELGDNRLNGGIPFELGDLENLVGLYLHGNQLSGEIPSELGNLTELNSFRLENNALEGDIPSSITDLINLGTSPADTDLGYNKLISSDPAVIAFLEDKDPDWDETQTIAPADLQINNVYTDTIVLIWTPITYTSHGGYYEISFALAPTGTYTVHGTTSDKTEVGYPVDDLIPGTPYNLRVRTYTPAHENQQNDLWSDYVQVVTTTKYTPVEADFSAAPTVGEAPLTVFFTNTSSGAYTESLWSFGDRLTSTQESPAHIYTANGIYTVSLTVSGPGGVDTLTRTNFIHVVPPESVVLTLVPLTTTAYLGQRFETSIQVQAGEQELDAAAAYLNFDPLMLQVISLTGNISVLPFVLTDGYDNISGTVDYAAGTFTNYPTGTFTLATVTFEAISKTTGTDIIYNKTLPRTSDTTFGGESVLHHTEDGTVTIENSSVLVGTVELLGRPDPPDPSWSIPLSLSLTDAGGRVETFTFTPTTDANGVFTLTGIVPGTYTARVKNSHTLQNTQVITLTPGVNIVNFGTLREGDANDDNFVSLVDFSILATTFGKCVGYDGYDERADFNEDDCVSLLDFSLLATYFGEGGDVLRGNTESPFGEGGESLKSIPIDRIAQPASSLNDVTISVIPPTSTANLGEPFTVTVQIESGNQLVDGVQAALDFDPAYLQVVAMNGNTDVLPLVLQNTFDNLNGSVDYSAEALSNFPSGSIDVVKIQFQAIQETANTALAFHFELPRNTDVTFGGVSVLSGFHDGVVVVGPPAVPTISVGNIRMRFRATSDAGANTNYHILASVPVRDQDGSPVPRARVIVRWRLPNGKNLLRAAFTKANRSALFHIKTPLAGRYILSVMNVRVNGYSYDPTQNLESRERIRVR